MGIDRVQHWATRSRSRAAAAVGLPAVLVLTPIGVVAGLGPGVAVAVGAGVGLLAGVIAAVAVWILHLRDAVLAGLDAPERAVVRAAAAGGAVPPDPRLRAVAATLARRKVGLLVRFRPWLIGFWLLAAAFDVSVIVGGSWSMSVQLLVPIGGIVLASTAPRRLRRVADALEAVAHS